MKTKLEKLLFSKVEVWVVLAIIISLLCGAVLFGYVAQERAKGSQIGGELGSVVSDIAGFPELISCALEEVGDTKGGRIIPLDIDAGINLNSFKGLENVPGYIASRSDGKDGKYYQLHQLSTGKLITRWSYSPGGIPAAISFIDDSLILKDVGGFEEATESLTKVDLKGVKIWSTVIAAHHAVHVDSGGRIYTPVVMPDHPNARFIADYRDDGYAVLSAGGEIMEMRSVSDILRNNNLGHLIYGVGAIEKDAIHLNSVKPAEMTTKYWRKGDLLMSSRHLSTVFLYRPETGKVIWHKTGPWLNQHDPDFMGTHQISVFGNDVVSAYENRTSKDAAFLSETNGADATNEIYIYDFITDSLSTPYSEFMGRIGLSTVTGGAHTILSDGSLFVYFSNKGLGSIFNKEKSTTHYFGVMAGQHTVSIGAAPRVYEIAVPEN